MLTAGGDSDWGCISELSHSAAQHSEQDDHCKAGPSGIPAAHPSPSEENNDAAADRLCRHRIDAPEAIDEGSFSYVAGLARALAFSLCYAAIVSD
jgi:hypothetical protein